MGGKLSMVGREEEMQGGGVAGVQMEKVRGESWGMPEW
jgi:hypothetical protein